VAVFSRNGKNDLLWIDTSLDKALNAAVGMKSSSINDAILNLLLVGQSVDEGSSNSQMLIKMRIINADDLIGS
jgi:hypothetical protein